LDNDFCFFINKNTHEIAFNLVIVGLSAFQADTALSAASFNVAARIIGKPLFASIL